MNIAKNRLRDLRFSPGARIARLEGGHKQIRREEGGTKTLILRIRESGPKNKGPHLEICANFHEFRGETKKRGLYYKICKKQFLLTNSRVITSILGVSGLELHSSDTEPVTFFWAQSSLGGHNSCLGGTSSNLGGTAPDCPPWRRACCNFTTIYRTVTTAFLLKRYSLKLALFKKWELFEVTKRCPIHFSTISFICDNAM